MASPQGALAREKEDDRGGVKAAQELLAQAGMTQRGRQWTRCRQGGDEERVLVAERLSARTQSKYANHRSQSEYVNKIFANTRKSSPSPATLGR